MTNIQAEFGRPPENRRLVVEKIPALVASLQSALEKLQRWDVRVPVLGRLRAAKARLEEVVSDGQYPAEESRLRLVTDSIVLARDFTLIIEALGDELAETISHQLSVALKGTLSGAERERAPYQFQSQFLFGAALVKAKLEPRIPSPESKGPDYVVCPGTVQYGVEVKRAARRRGAFDLLKSARNQLSSAGLHGVVVLDLSDCLDDLGLRRVDDDAAFPSDDLRVPYKELVDELSDVVWNWQTAEYRPRFERVMALWYIVRGWRWLSSDRRAPHLFEFQGFHRFASAKGNVWHHRADEFHRLVMEGMKASGLFINVGEHESPHHISQPFWEQWRDVHGA